MKGTEAVIKVFVPGFQLGQNVTVYFPDTMIKKGVCEENPVVRCKDCKFSKPDWEKARWCEREDCRRHENWFCADGERREGR